MGLPALLAPWATQPSLPPVDRASLDRLNAEVRSLLDDVRRDRPAEGTLAEATALLRVSAFSLSVLRVLGPAFLQVLRSGVNQLLTDLVRKELDAAEPERKLALRHVEQAVHTYGVLMESFGALLGDLPPASMRPLFDELADQVKSGELPMPEGDRVVLRFQLHVLVVLDVLDASLEDLTFWAFRAITDARRVEAMPIAVTPAGLRGELARIRAGRSWAAWDEAEMAKELAPWPTPSP